MHDSIALSSTAYCIMLDLLSVAIKGGWGSLLRYSIRGSLGGQVSLSELDLGAQFLGFSPRVLP